MVDLSSNKSIKIPSQHYIGMQKRSVDAIPLGFMTPDGTDKAAQKRKDTIDRWASGNNWYSNGKQATLPPSSVENKPMNGFKFSRLIGGGGRGWDARSDAWRVIDPRGFELEIGSGNVEEIMDVCTIVNGEILQDCVWGRLGSNNILIPVTSDAYEAATANTDRMGKSVSVRDIKPGNKIIFKNGDEGIYYGRMFLYGYYYRNAEKTEYLDDSPHQLLLDKGLHVYAKLNSKGDIDNSIVARDSLSLSAAQEFKELTIDDTCRTINEKIQSCHFDLPSKLDYSHILQVMPTKTGTISNYVTAISSLGDINNVKNLIESTTNYYNFGLLVGCKVPGINPDLGFVSISRHDFQYNRLKLDSFAQLDQDRVKDPNNGRIVLYRTKERRSYSYSYYSDQYYNSCKTYNLPVENKDLEFFKLVATYNDYAGNPMTFNLSQVFSIRC
jgi:hypothetical protein